MPTEEREKRICDVCGQVDTAPRHVFVQQDPSNPFPVNENFLAEVAASEDLTSAEKRLLALDIRDTSIQQRHMDCCAQAGCPDGTCDVIVERANGKQNDQLVKFIVGGNVDGVGEEVKK